MENLATDSKQQVVPRIPEDLIYIILGHLSKDTHSLQSCATVSRFWLDATRPVLFESVTILLAPKPSPPYDPTAPSEKPASFFNFLSDTPSVRTLVRTLTFANHRCMVWDIVRIVNQLPRLRALKLRHVFITGSTQKAPIMAHLEYLHIYNCLVDDSPGYWEPFFDLVNGFSSAKELKIYHVYRWPSDILPDPSSLPASTHHIKSSVDSLTFSFFGLPPDKETLIRLMPLHLSLENVTRMSLRTSSNPQCWIDRALNLRTFHCDVDAIMDCELNIPNA